MSERITLNLFKFYLYFLKQKVSLLMYSVAQNSVLCVAK